MDPKEDLEVTLGLWQWEEDRRDLHENEIIELIQQRYQSSTICWDEKLLPFPYFHYSLFQDSNSLWFAATIPYPCRYPKEYDDLTFVEGLWNKDVVELFLLDSLTGNYLELNFSPINAWWYCEFESYRQPKSSVTSSITVKYIRYHVEDSFWSVLVSLDRTSLPIQVQSSTLVHISSIVPESPPIYLTSNTRRISSFVPDFHRTESFLPLKVRQIDSMVSKRI